MSSPAVQMLLIGMGALALGVFVVALRFALNEAMGERQHSEEPDLPRAELHGARVMSGNRWHRGAAKQRLVHYIRYAQAGLVAFAVTAVFIMFLCMCGIIGAMLFGTANAG